MHKFEKLLSGGDLRSLGKSSWLVSNIQSQTDFDILFEYLSKGDRIEVMRASDAIEKITINYPSFLTKHKRKILELCETAIDKELKWHLALLVPRLHLSRNELGKSWDILTNWAKDKNNSRIVRVHSIQGLFELTKKETDLKQDLNLTLLEIMPENIPSINARIRKIKGQDALV